MVLGAFFGLAVLAAGAMVASLLAVGAAPAGAQVLGGGSVNVDANQLIDHRPETVACVGDALDDQMFTDVVDEHAFRDAINCIAYYGITKGTGDGSTFSPDQEVTRAEMAVFIARAARVAGVELDPGSGDFSDLGGAWVEARDAIDRLASNGIIPSGGVFRPGDAITRAEMAGFLIGLLDKAAPNVEVDAAGAILLGAAGSQTQADDWFPDAADSAEASALYELGVTTGAGPAAAQDPTEPPLDYNYEPAGTVDRGQMAAFITRALAHTSARPAGVTAQYDASGIVVSVRDSRFQPVPAAAVDVFWAAADRAGRAVGDDGACRVKEVTQADRSSLPCEIDETDPATGRGGDARVEVAGLRRVPAGGAAVWAWTGHRGDTLEAGVGAYRLDLADDQVRAASRALVTTPFDVRKVRFGNSVVYSIQLQDPVGNVHRGVDGIDPAQWRLTVQVLAPRWEPVVRTLVSGPSGEVRFPITLADPNPALDNFDELIVAYTLTPAGNAPPTYATVDAGGRPAARGTVTFSDYDRTVDGATIDTRRYVLATGGEASNTATVTVLDQYGAPYPEATVTLDSSLTFDSSLNEASPGSSTVDGRGSHRFSYRYSRTAVETLTASYSVDNSPGSKAATVYWTADADPNQHYEGSGRPVLTGDIHRNHIVVDDFLDNIRAPVLLIYDDNDRFNLNGFPATLAAFEVELAEAIERDNADRSLTWSNYRPHSDGRVTQYNLS